MSDYEWLESNGYARTKSSKSATTFSKSHQETVVVTLTNYKKPASPSEAWMCSVSIGVELSSAHGPTFRHALSVATMEAKSRIARIHECVNQL